MTKLPDPKIYNIPPGLPFADTLAAGLLQEAGKTPEKLADYLILLPTRRACRAVQEAFLRQTDGEPLILPRLQPIGDIDAEELFLSADTNAEMDILPAMPPLKRQILLAHTIAALPDFDKGPAQNMALAKALGALMDEIHTENLHLSDLPKLVDRDAFAKHWQITVDFLSILSEHWPKILDAHGLIDASDRRNRLINALNTHWQNNPPQTPVLAAGSTGSIPATAALLKTIATLPHGSVILPGLDQYMDEAAWKNVAEGHPQAAFLKEFLNDHNFSRQDVKLWPYAKQQSDDNTFREELISHVMTPPDNTDSWQSENFTSAKKTNFEKTIAHVKRYNCATPQEEAQLIALLLRETLETKTARAALITSDRNLAQRVTVACKRWDIEIDDSAGQPLNQSKIGSYLRLCAQAAISNTAPLSLLALLKHDLTQGAGFKNFRRTVRAMDRDILRGPQGQKGFAGLRQRFDDKMNDKQIKRKPDLAVLSLLDHIEPIFTEAINIFSGGFHNFSGLLEAHLKLAQILASSDTKNGEKILWQGDDGEAAATFLSQLREQEKFLPRLRGEDYLAILDEFMSAVTVRPKYGTHPRLMILGQLEARLVQADRVILAGLNEGSWPPDPGHDPWMSRQMRQNFGLPTPEHAITLAAHDFVQGFCSKEVFLTRSERVDGTPTRPARWLARLDTFLQAAKIDPKILQNGPHKNYVRLLNDQPDFKPLERPKPTPPVAARPQQLSVTKIDKWLQDPYGIYAEKILGLRKLDPIEKQPDAAERGTLLHEMMEHFTTLYAKNIPDDAQKNFITIARDVLKDHHYDPIEWSFWLSRMARLSDWIIPHEKKWRDNVAQIKTEIGGTIEISEGLDTPFTLTARADRIDIMKDGTAAIIDYKSGGTYSATKIQSGALSQLPLEALILTDGGFKGDGMAAKSVGYIGYWKLSGGRPAGETKDIRNTDKITQAIETAKDGLTELVRIFNNQETPYMAIPRLDNPPRFNDYEYLERVKEWAALDENSEEAA